MTVEFGVTLGRPTNAGSAFTITCRNLSHAISAVVDMIKASGREGEWSIQTVDYVRGHGMIAVIRLEDVVAGVTICQAMIVEVPSPVGHTPIP